jgi:HK97 gp10 family phage protein
MSNTSSFEIKGLKELYATLKELPNAVKKVAAPAVFAGAKVSRDSIQQLASEHHRTGLMENSIKIGRRRRGVPDGQIQYAIFVRVRSRTSIKKARQAGKGVSPGQAGYDVFVGPYYWRFLEFGTSKMSAKPFMVPGFVRSANGAAMTVREEARSRMGKEIARIKKATPGG